MCLILMQSLCDGVLCCSTCPKIVLFACAFDEKGVQFYFQKTSSCVNGFIIIIFLLLLLLKAEQERFFSIKSVSNLLPDFDYEFESTLVSTGALPGWRTRVACYYSSFHFVIALFFDFVEN